MALSREKSTILPPGISLRRATRKDISLVAKFCHAYDLYENGLDKRVEITPIGDYQKEILGMLRRKVVFLLIKDLSRPIGFIDYRIDGAYGRKEGVLKDIFIEATRRGRGIGGRVVDYVLDEMVSEGCKTVRSGVRAKNARSQKFWQRRGFKIEFEPLNYPMKRRL